MDNIVSVLPVPRLGSPVLFGLPLGWLMMVMTPLLLTLLLACTYGLKHQLTISDDSRSLFKIETFGFLAEGRVDLSVTNIYVGHPVRQKKPKRGESKYRMGFVVRRAASESQAQRELEDLTDKGRCIFDEKKEFDLVMDLSDRTQWEITHKASTIIPEKAKGLYSLIFQRCAPSGYDHTVGFQLDATFKNVGHSLVGSGPEWDYLSAGDAPLPLVFMLFSILFLMALILWVWVLGHDSNKHGQVHKIHHLMTVLCGLKLSTLILESVRYHSISRNGTTWIWSYIYYAFATLKGIMLFIVISLIGTGWSIVKGALNETEKKLICTVLILQVINNLAMVYVEETSPGSVEWLSWRDLFHLVDIVCCCAILFPIIWSIRHLRGQVGVDGKVKHTLERLKLFRTFYILVVFYIYFTRIIVFLLESTMPFDLMWLGTVATEAAALCFYLITGYTFQPTKESPYLKVSGDDNEDDDDISEMERATSLGIEMRNRDV